MHQSLSEAGVSGLGISVSAAGKCPERLFDATVPARFLDWLGWWDLVEFPCVAVTGSRGPSRDGVSRTRHLVRHLFADGPQAEVSTIESIVRHSGILNTGFADHGAQSGQAPTS